jgi:transposase-like protein
MRWPIGAGCPRCGDTKVRMQDPEGNRNARFLWRCYGCKKQFPVRAGTVLEDSPVKLGVGLRVLAGLREQEG